MDRSSILLLSTAYLPPIEYFYYLVNNNAVVIEYYETYPKQTYRNRCEIYSANGKLTLTIPVVKTNGNHTMTKDVEISYANNWQKTHWRAIESAYNGSPFFMFYRDLLSPFYERNYKYLVDYNNELLELLLKQLKLEVSIGTTEKYEKQVFNTIDMRELIHPKRTSKIRGNEMNIYTQVFENKCGFLPNLSIIDLLFNEGNFSKDFLLRIATDSQI